MKYESIICVTGQTGKMQESQGLPLRKDAGKSRTASAFCLVFTII